MIFYVLGRKNFGLDVVLWYFVGLLDCLNLFGEVFEFDFLVNMIVYYYDIFISLCLYIEDNDIVNDIFIVVVVICVLNVVIIVVIWSMVCEVIVLDFIFVNFIRQMEVGFLEDYKELLIDLCFYYCFVFSLCIVDGVVFMG